MRERDHPETAAFFCWGNGAEKQGAITQSDGVCAQIAGGVNPGSGGSPNNWLRTLRDDLAVLLPTEGSTKGPMAAWN